LLASKYLKISMNCLDTWDRYPKLVPSGQKS